MPSSVVLAPAVARAAVSAAEAHADERPGHPEAAASPAGAGPFSEAARCDALGEAGETPGQPLEPARPVASGLPAGAPA
jgi:hypothetical protein